MKSKRYHIIIATIIFAILMWCSINMNLEYVTSIQVPVEIINLPANLALTKPIPKFINLTIKGTGWNLTALHIRNTPKHQINMANYNIGNTIYHVAQTHKEYNLASSIEILAVHPDTINISLEKYIRKKVKIFPQVELNFRESYALVEEPYLSPDTVMVGGGSSVIDTINFWPTKKIILTELSEPVEMALDLETPPDYLVNLYQKKVMYKLIVQPFAEKSIIGLGIDINYLPPNKEVVFIPPKINLIIRGSISILQNVSNKDFKATVNYHDLIKDSLDLIQPQIHSPEGIKIVKRSPEKFQFIIRKRLQ